jgi:hypothetical protein
MWHDARVQRPDIDPSSIVAHLDDQVVALDQYEDLYLWGAAVEDRVGARFLQAQHDTLDVPPRCACAAKKTGDLAPHRRQCRRVGGHDEMEDLHCGRWHRFPLAFVVDNTD